MNTISIFILLIVALVGTLAFFSDPLGKLAKWISGRNTKDLMEEADAWLEGDPDIGQILWKGCGFVLSIILALMFTWVIQPLAVIYALTNKMGYMSAAYAMAVIIAISWIRSIYNLKKSSKTDLSKKTVVRTESGERVEGVVENADVEIPKINMLVRNTKRLFFALPTFYLWYLFAVLIGVLSS